MSRNETEKANLWFHSIFSKINIIDDRIELTPYEHKIELKTFKPTNDSLPLNILKLKAKEIASSYESDFNVPAFKDDE